MDDLIFTMLLVELSEKRLVLQAEFQNPLSVSIGSKPDVLKVQIVDPNLFIGKESGKTLQTDSVYEMTIPRLFNNQQTFEIVTSADEALGSVYQLSSTTTLLIALFINFSMKPLWIFKNVMQVIVHCRILRQLPANLGTTLDALNYAVYLKPHYLLAEEILRKYFMDDIEIDEVQSKIMKEYVNFA